MSYEGYTQYICINNHQYDLDALEEAYSNNRVCVYCGSLNIIWRNDVDQTNDNPPAFTNFRIKKECVQDNCSECGKTKTIISAEEVEVPTLEEMILYEQEVVKYYKLLYKQ